MTPDTVRQEDWSRMTGPPPHCACMTVIGPQIETTRPVSISKPADPTRKPRMAQTLAPVLDQLSLVLRPHDLRPFAASYTLWNSKSSTSPAGPRRTQAG